MANQDTHLSLSDIAKQAMKDKNMIPDFPPDVVQEVANIPGPAAPLPSPLLKDQRNLLWVSIDNDDSKDLDQISYAEGNTVYVAIADVDALVKKNSPIDRFAYTNTTTVYTPTIIFPMLPTRLSTDLTSLGENQDRCAIVVEVVVDDTGKYTAMGVYPSLVRNKAKLSYRLVSEWLEKGFPDDKKNLKDQLVLQDQIAQRIKAYRIKQGTLTFDTMELQTQTKNGQVVGIQEMVHYRADEIIENLMIASNVIVSQFLNTNKTPFLKRIVRTPKRWDRIVQLAKEHGTDLPPQPDVMALSNFLNEQNKKDPDNFQDLSLSIIKLVGRGEYYAFIPGQDPQGHFDLGLIDYAHTTAPNRRFPDIVMQRFVKSVLYKQPQPYTNNELVAIAQQCTQKEDDATKVGRRMEKSSAALVLSSKIGQEFPSIVTGASDKGTYVRIEQPPIEGKLVQGNHNVDVGDKIRVKLIHTDVVNGFIDFARVG